MIDFIEAVENFRFSEEDGKGNRLVVNLSYTNPFFK